MALAAVVMVTRVGRSSRQKGKSWEMWDFVELGKGVRRWANIYRISVGR